MTKQATSSYVHTFPATFTLKRQVLKTINKWKTINKCKENKTILEKKKS